MSSNAVWNDPQQGRGDVFGLFKTLLDRAGENHLFVTSAGNQYMPLQAQTSTSKYHWMPAQLRLDNMIVVGALGGCTGRARQLPACAAAWPGRGRKPELKCGSGRVPPGSLAVHLCPRCTVLMPAP